MFGFLNPRPHSFAYRRHYARLCVHLRRWYGLAALPFHSYEAVFLYQLAADAGRVPEGVLPKTRCCRLARKGDPGRDADAHVGKTCASVGVLLASVKLDDDVRDRRSLAARAVRAVLGGPIARAKRHLATLDPRFAETVAALVAEHHALEARPRAVSLGDYVEPTALAFGYVFGLAGHEAFRGVGRHVGAALIAYDCAVDWPRDRRRGEYNPLADEAAVRDALAFSADELTAAAALCRSAFGHDSAAARTLATVARRVVGPAHACATERSPLRVAWDVARQAFAPAALVGVSASAGEPPPIPGGGPADGGRMNRPAPQATPGTGQSSASTSCDPCSGCGNCGGGDCGGCDGCGCDGCGDCGGGCNCG